MLSLVCVVGRSIRTRKISQSRYLIHSFVKTFTLWCCYISGIRLSLKDVVIKYFYSLINEKDRKNHYNTVK